MEIDHPMQIESKNDNLLHNLNNKKKLLLDSNNNNNNDDSDIINDNNEFNNLSNEMDRLRHELRDSKRKVYEREQQLLKLHREVHKLRSVLDHSDAMNVTLKMTSSQQQQQPFDSFFVNNLNAYDHHMNYIDNYNRLDVTQPEKKKGVSGESLNSTGNNGIDDGGNDGVKNRSQKIINFFWKDFDCRRIIQEALMDNSFLKNYLNNEQIDLIVNSMYVKEFAKSRYICRRGTYGSHLYVISYGKCEVIDARDRPVNQMGPGKAFGELALLYNCTRTASVRALTRVRTWVLDRKVFQMIMMKTSLDRTNSIKQFLKKVPLLQNLNDEKITKITDAVEVDYYPRGEYICRQGCFGDSFYIISKGSVRVTKVRSINNPNNHQYYQQYSMFVDNNHINGNNMNDDNDIEMAIKEDTIRTLNEGDYFGEQALLLLEGARETLLTTPSNNNNNHNNIDLTAKTALIKTELSDNIGAIRTANVISEDCECLVLDQTNFFNLLGELQEIKYKSYTDSINGNRKHSNTPDMMMNELEKYHHYHYSKSSTLSSTTRTIVNENDLTPFELFIKNLKLTDLETITQLGMGGFGAVNLVRCYHDHDKVFAMKKCSKEFIRASRQQQHIVNEKLVMQCVAGHNQFIIKLYRTFQDDFNVYFLMETALGGELWTVLRQRGPFNEQSVRFYTACVVEALQYLHSKNIIYRDLKPENCLLDSDGYLKLTDFGFSKHLPAGKKTWTFCGTPEYVAPEIILNRGHDKSVDIWALGILIYELLTGLPPFISSDPLQTYHIILRGFDSIGFDENIFSKHCVNLIRSLCRENPNERLIIRGRNGYNDIKRHKWFTGFNWNNLLQRKMIAPIVPKLTSNTDTRHFECFNTDDVIDKVIGDNNNNDQKPKEKFIKNKHSGSTSSSWFKSLSNCSGSGRNSLSNKKTITTPEQQQQQRTDHKNNSGGGVFKF
ncbi:cgmp-dependent protein kinase 1-like [Dermatophagoides farinae]|uniref:cGMP-dependent protein kinase n=1 Tax=Dermatophagoides farinae TaxID=6954 RepID=A0A9D4SFM2_DERFA|nr:cgmp-dependent protein kinase 1-like [Dermatophagoides farinae]